MRKACRVWTWDRSGSSLTAWFSLVQWVLQSSPSEPQIFPSHLAYNGNEQLGLKVTFGLQMFCWG